MTNRTEENFFFQQLHKTYFFPIFNSKNVLLQVYFKIKSYETFLINVENIKWGYDKLFNFLLY